MHSARYAFGIAEHHELRVENKSGSYAIIPKGLVRHEGPPFQASSYAVSPRRLVGYEEMLPRTSNLGLYHKITLYSNSHGGCAHYSQQAQM